ncbi:MAG TPA: SMP-30/gluconolactonase/LRE family protein [Chryseosolibacter sp.]|nr:SMP-30/gluconolactonase/LRE family protein [Chryseosolibacter sp.]
MSEESSRVETVLAHTCLLGEGPVWDVRTKSICWVDILNKQVHEYSTSRQLHRVINVESMPGAIALCRDGNFLVALKEGIAWVDRNTAHARILCHPEIHVTGNRFNDGKCDPAGRFWIGTMALSEEAGAGNLYMVENDLTWKLKLPGVSISNGMAWSSDFRTYYYIDTPTRQVAAFDFQMETGDISNRRIVLEIPSSEGFPDGMTIDTEGRLWVAHWDGWQVSCWDPLKGQKLRSIEFPASQITSCTFGGDNMNDLYVTSARKGLDEHALKRQPLAGSLFVVRGCGASGHAPFEFEIAGVR